MASWQLLVFSQANTQHFNASSAAAPQAATQFSALKPLGVDLDWKLVSRQIDEVRGVAYTQSSGLSLLQSEFSSYHILIRRGVRTLEYLAAGLVNNSVKPRKSRFLRHLKSKSKSTRK